MKGKRDGTCLEALLECPRDEFGLVDLTSWLQRLQKLGWTSERLAKNDLPVWTVGDPYFPYRMEDLWVTALEITNRLGEIDVAPIMLKCLREYPYADSNVDVLIPPGRWDDVTNHLASAGWVMPSRSERLEQSLFERAKMKMLSSRQDLLAVHLYGAVSWRYLDDLGLLRHGAEPNEEELVREPFERFMGSQVDTLPTWLYLPSPSAELVIQAAHICFENYRITIGEAVHFVLLRNRVPEAWEEAVRIAERIGCRRALDLVSDASIQVLNTLENARPADFPKPLSSRSLLKCFKERQQALKESGSLVRSVFERLGSTAFYLGVRLIRIFRRIRRGHEDYRKPTFPPASLS